MSTQNIVASTLEERVARMEEALYRAEIMRRAASSTATLKPRGKCL